MDAIGGHFKPCVFIKVSVWLTENYFEIATFG